MKNLSIHILAFAISMAICVACSNDSDDNVSTQNVKVLTGINADIYGTDAAITRASNTTEKEPIYVGRQVFVGGDKIVMTSFQRTDNPISDFTYNDIRWKKGGNEGETEGGWNRDNDDSENNEKKIYWSDAKNYHTVVGYSIPQEMPTENWSKTAEESVNNYEGQLTLSDNQVIYDSIKNLTKDDVVLTYSKEIKSDATGIATIYFQHALSCLTVDVNIQGFAATPGMGAEEKDNASRVKDLIILKQPYKYMWKQTSDSVETIENDDLKADIKAFTNNADGEGSGNGRRFYFHALAVPGSRDAITIKFDVTYPNPLKPTTTITNTYKATAQNVNFLAGKRTTIKINLNHENEKITVGAIYDDWVFKDTPDQGNLDKNLTYLASTESKSVKLHNEKGLTIDDATWLYMDGENIKDIYGNDGTKDKPYTISTANQLLAFAYEVNEGGMSFIGKYVRLDASIHMQPTTSSNNVEWIGIGTQEHPFEGNFDGGLRDISYLKGKSLFGNISTNAIVEGLSLSRMIGTTDGGSIACVNNGTVYGCMVKGDVSGTTNAGGICASNSGTIMACAHIGDVTTTNETDTKAGGMAGENNENGTILASYFAGNLTASTTSPQCYFNSDLYPPTSEDNGEEKWAKTTIDMIMQAFVNDLNFEITDSRTKQNLRKYQFIYQPSEYPSLVSQQKNVE